MPPVTDACPHQHVNDLSAATSRALCNCRPFQTPAKPTVVLPVVDRILLVDMGVHLVITMKDPETLIQLGVPGLELRMLFHKPLRTLRCVSAGQLCIPCMQPACASGGGCIQLLGPNVFCITEASELVAVVFGAVHEARCGAETGL